MQSETPQVVQYQKPGCSRYQQLLIPPSSLKTRRVPDAESGAATGWKRHETLSLISKLFGSASLMVRRNSDVQQKFSVGSHRSYLSKSLVIDLLDFAIDLNISYVWNG